MGKKIKFIRLAWAEVIRYVQNQRSKNNVHQSKSTEEENITKRLKRIAFNAAWLL